MLLFAGGYLRKNVSLGYIFLVLTVLIPFYCWMYLGKEKNTQNKERYTGKRNTHAHSKLTVTNWFIERDLREKNDKSIPKIRMVKKMPIKWDVYSEDFEIEDVWNIGKSIKRLDDKTILKDEFVLLENHELDRERFKDYL